MGAEPPAPVVAGPSARRLLFSATKRPEVGLVVQRIEPESPVTDMRRDNNPGMRVILAPGDIVTHVEGRRIDSLPTYYRLLAEGGEAVRLMVMNRRTGCDPLPKFRSRSCERILVPRLGLERVLG